MIIEVLVGIVTDVKTINVYRFIPVTVYDVSKVVIMMVIMIRL